MHDFCLLNLCGMGGGHDIVSHLNCVRINSGPLWITPFGSIPDDVMLIMSNTMPWGNTV